MEGLNDTQTISMEAIIYKISDLFFLRTYCKGKMWNPMSTKFISLWNHFSFSPVFFRKDGVFQTEKITDISNHIGKALCSIFQTIFPLKKNNIHICRTELPLPKIEKFHVIRKRDVWFLVEPLVVVEKVKLSNVKKNIYKWVSFYSNSRANYLALRSIF